MSVRDLLLVYGLLGIAAAILILRRAPGPLPSRALSAALAIPLWPVWAPFALAQPTAPKTHPRPPQVARIDRALALAVESVAGSPIADVFSPKIAARIAEEVANVAVRMGELTALAQKSGFDAQAARTRLRDLEAAGAPERMVQTARMQLESLARLEELRATDARALDELAELLEALRTQLVLARYAGSNAEGVSALVGEVWARLEGLGAAFEPPEPPGARGGMRGECDRAQGS